MKIKNVLCEKNISTGYLYFYIHFIVEVACFYYLSSLVGDSAFLWIMPLLYDAIAFVPQSIIGYISDKYPKIKFGIIGVFLVIASFILCFTLNINSVYIPLLLLCFGNALIHVNGAEVTLTSSEGKMSHSAIFIAGGSFGVVTGKLIAKTVPYYIVILLMLTVIPFILLAEYKRNNKSNKCSKFNYASNKPQWIIILLAFLVVISRSYMGYGIPTSWNKSIMETILLYSFMGIGKALGGILIDLIGMRKTAYISVLFSIPFLLFGDNIMIVSLIGVMMFSMTMAITLGLLTSVLKNTPGLAFGITTIGLFLGTIPIFIVKITSFTLNSIIILSISLLCLIMLMTIIKKEKKV